MGQIQNNSAEGTKPKFRPLPTVNQSLSEVFSESWAEFLVSRWVCLHSEEIFYMYRERERRKESSSFLLHSPKRLGKMGAQSWTEPPVNGVVRTQIDAGTGCWHGARLRCSAGLIGPSVPSIPASTMCCPLLSSPALQRAFMRNWLCFSHCLFPWPSQDCSGLVHSSTCPGAHLGCYGTVSLSAWALLVPFPSWA